METLTHSLFPLLTHSLTHSVVVYTLCIASPPLILTLTRKILYTVLD